MTIDMYASVEAHADGNDPISYSGQLFLYRPFANETARNENPSPALSIADFPFRFEDHDDFIFTDLLFEHQPLADQEAEDHKVSDQIPVLEKNWETDQHVTENPPNHDNHQQQQKKKIETPRKRPSKRDRHTKIKTAQGLRDRRVRLSLEVAGSFFRLQDMLRFDKASKTIDWLLNQAKDEINARLEREKSENNVLISSSPGVQSMSSTSECEVPGLDEVTGSAANDKQDEAKPSVKERRIKLSRKILLKPRPKEVRAKARAKARERARERTKEKIMRSKKLVVEESRHSTEATNYRTHIVGEDSHTTCQSNTNRSLDEVTKDQGRSLQSKDHSGASYEQSLLTVSKSDSPFLFSSLHNSATIQDHQFAVLQYLNKPWEAYSFHTLH